LEEASIRSYSQVATNEEMTVRQKNPPTAPSYPDLTEAIEKAMSASDISESDEPATVESLHKSHIDRKYARIARQWGFDSKKTKEEILDIMQQKIAALEERLDEQRFPREEEEIELEAGKKLLKILPAVMTSLMPISIEKDSQQKKLSFEDLPSTSQSSYQTYNPVTPTSNIDFEILWQKAIKRFGFSKEKPENNERLVNRIRDINQSRLDYYAKKQDKSMIQAYQSQLATL